MKKTFVSLILIISMITSTIIPAFAAEPVSNEISEYYIVSDFSLLLCRCRYSTASNPFQVCKVTIFLFYRLI